MMKNIGIKFTIVSLLMVSSFVAFGQTEDLSIENESYKKHLIFATYNIGVATGNTSDFIDAPSFKGGSFEYRQMFTEKFSGGVSIAYQRFYEDKGKQLVHYNGHDIYGTQYNWQHSLPVMITGHYYPKGLNNKISPYVGFGVGASREVSEVNVGSVGFEESEWQLGLTPEVGAIVELSNRLRLTVAAQYKASFEVSDIESQSNLGFKFGFVTRF